MRHVIYKYYKSVVYSPLMELVRDVLLVDALPKLSLNQRLQTFFIFLLSIIEADIKIVTPLLLGEFVESIANETDGAEISVVPSLLKLRIDQYDLLLWYILLSIFADIPQHLKRILSYKINGSLMKKTNEEISAFMRECSPAELSKYNVELAQIPESVVKVSTKYYQRIIAIWPEIMTFCLAIMQINEFDKEHKERHYSNATVFFFLSVVWVLVNFLIVYPFKKRHERKAKEAYSRYELNFVESCQYHSEVIAYERQVYEIKKNKVLLDQFVDWKAKEKLLDTGVDAVSDFFSKCFAGYYIFYLATRGISSDQIDALIFGTYLFKYIESINLLGHNFEKLSEKRQFIRHLKALIKKIRPNQFDTSIGTEKSMLLKLPLLVNGVFAPEKEAETKVVAVDQDAIVCFDRVGFPLLELKDQPLSEISFNVLPGELVILLGRNGSGKSTVLNLLSRQQSAYVGNIDFNFCSRGEHFPNIHYLAHRPNIFTNTLKYNLVYSLLDTPDPHVLNPMDDEMIQKIIKQFKLGQHHLVSDSQAPILNQKGVSDELAYRIGAARIYLRIQKQLAKNQQNLPSQLMVIDQPPGGLDMFSKDFILSQLVTPYLKKFTYILSTQEMSLIEQADKIIFLHLGKAYIFAGDNTLSDFITHCPDQEYSRVIEKHCQNKTHTGLRM